MFNNMKSIMCCCLAISLMPVHETLVTDGECMEPQLLLKGTYCGTNMTSLTMHTFQKESLEVSVHDGCDVDFDQKIHLNDSFYFECDTEINCLSSETKEISRDTYYLECGEVDIFSKEIVIPKQDNELNVTRNEMSDSDGVLDDSTSLEVHVFMDETTTQFNGILNNGITKSSEADFTSESTTKLFDVSTDDQGNSSEEEIIRNEITSQPNVHVTKNLIETDSSNIKTKAAKISLDSNILAILGYSVAGIAATVGLAYGAYKLKNVLQSGSYKFPDTPNPPNLIELA